MRPGHMMHCSENWIGKLRQVKFLTTDVHPLSSLCSVSNQALYIMPNKRGFSPKRRSLASAAHKSEESSDRLSKEAPPQIKTRGAVERYMKHEASKAIIRLMTCKAV